MGKLIRDKIPLIIEQAGKKAVTRIMDDQEYQTELRKKLLEEVNEYLADPCIEELADMLEVMHNLADMSEVEAVRKSKQSERGGFTQKIYLEKVD